MSPGGTRGRGKIRRSSGKKTALGKGRGRRKSNGSTKVSSVSMEGANSVPKDAAGEVDAVGKVGCEAEFAEPLSQVNTIKEDNSTFDTKSEESKVMEGSLSVCSATLPTADKDNHGENNLSIEGSAPIVESDINSEDDTDEGDNPEGILLVPDNYWTASLTLEDGSMVPSDNTLNTMAQMRSKKRMEDKVGEVHRTIGNTDGTVAAGSRNLEQVDEKSNDNFPDGNFPGELQQTLTVASSKKMNRFSRKRSLLALRKIRKQSVALRRLSSISREDGRAGSKKLSSTTLAKAPAVSAVSLTASSKGSPKRPCSRAPGPTNLESDHYRLGMEAAQLPRQNGVLHSATSTNFVVKTKKTKADGAVEEFNMQPENNSEVAQQAAADLRVSISWSIRKAKQLQQDICEQQRQLDSVLGLLNKQRQVSEMLTDIVGNRSNPLMMLDLRNLVKGLHKQQMQLGAALPSDPETLPALPERQ